MAEISDRADRDAAARRCATCVDRFLPGRGHGAGASTASASTSTPGGTLGIVGESGCGKSVTARVDPAASSTGRAGSSAGEIAARPPGTHGAAVDLAGARPPTAARCARSAAAEIALIFQEPMTVVQPVTHGRQPDHRGDPLHTAASARRRRASAAIELLQRGRHPARRRRASTPIRSSSAAACASASMIAMALACDPRHPDRRRADHRARRDHPGADPRPAAPAAADRTAWRSC